MNDFLTPEELARILRVRPTTLANWRCSARGPAYFRFEGVVCYRVGDVVAWMEEHRVETLDTVRLPG